MKTKILKISTGNIQKYNINGKEFSSAYKKNIYHKTIKVYKDGLEGDFQADKRYHGGDDKAILVSSNIHFNNYFQETQKQLDPLSFGQNILVDEFDEHNVYVGDIYTIGNIKVQVTQPRQPCWKIGALFSKDSARYIKLHSATGWYLKVLNTGVISNTNQMKLEQRVSNISIYNMTQYLNNIDIDKKTLELLLSYDFVANSYKNDIKNLKKL